MELTTFIHGSAHDLHQLADQSVQMIATSPPYYGLRAYAGEQGVEWPEVTFRLNEWVEPTTVPGCDPNCAHEWTDEDRKHPMDRNGAYGPKQSTNKGAAHINDGAGTGAYCSRCGGWRGGLGVEPSPVAFIGHLILCLREWRRVLRDDGVCFVNLGDSYAGSNALTTNEKALAGKQGTNRGTIGALPRRVENNGVKPKDLLGIPWLFAIAARADGWYLRSDIIWAKPNPMPESVTDRPTKAHEYVFLLSKSQRYFWDAEGVKEPATATELGATGILFGGTKYPGKGVADGTYSGNEYVSTGTRNLRTVWTIATQPTPFAHFATWPEKLVQTMIRAGSSERGACPHCGKAWERQVEREGSTYRERRDSGITVNWQPDSKNRNGRAGEVKTTTLAWQPACTCPAHEPVPCVVLDPFNGSGTTGKVAVQLGRAYVGVDIATEYLDGVTSERFGEGVQIGMGI